MYCLWDYCWFKFRNLWPSPLLVISVFPIQTCVMVCLMGLLCFLTHGVFRAAVFLSSLFGKKFWLPLMAAVGVAWHVLVSMGISACGWGYPVISWRPFFSSPSSLLSVSCKLLHTAVYFSVRHSFAVVRTSALLTISFQRRWKTVILTSLSFYVKGHVAPVD